MAAKTSGTCCSIETEPRTLREGQLNQAREVAADVALKLEHSEASTIFTDEGVGRQVIGATKEITLEILVEEEEDKKDVLPICEVVVACDENVHQIIERPCQCSILATNITSIGESPDVIREPLSAPF